MEVSSILPNGKSYDFWEDTTVYVREIHVDINNPLASDSNDGSLEKPFKTINAAAQVAEPGTKVLIHEGMYRECVHPAMGGTDEAHMISYEAFGSDKPQIKASEVVTDFKESTDWNFSGFFFGSENNSETLKIWEHDLDPDMFRGYNPFCCVNILHDRLFIEYEKTDMTTYLNRRGMVFVDGKPLKQVALSNHLGENEDAYWVEANGQKIHFRLKGDDDPKNHVIEITVREQCFAPLIPFISFIHIKGLTCMHAATGAPVPQRGAISAYRGHHWIMEDCSVIWSNAVGIDVGNECWHHKFEEDRINGFSVIRRCHIKDAGVCGIAGLYARQLLIEDCLIEGTGWQKMELSWEAGAIKLHNSENALIRRNIFRDTFRADHIWLDCGNVNNRITNNLFLNGIEQREAIFIECTREGINLIDNNIIWNVEGRFDPKQIPNEPGSKGWYKMVEDDVVNGYAVYGEGTDHLQVVHNFIGKCRYGGYYMKPVGFRISPGDRGGTSVDALVKNNMFYECGVSAITFPTNENRAEGNMYVRMPGGYLRVMYPAPEKCLHLPAWKEFMGYDLDGQEGFFDVKIDDEKLTLEFTRANGRPFGFGRRSVEERNYVCDVEKIKGVEPDDRVKGDYSGLEAKNGLRLPGVFAEIKENVVYSIDPRKMGV